MAQIVVKVGTATVVMTGIEFMTYANRYFDAEEALRGQSRDEWFDPIPYHTTSSVSRLNYISSHSSGLLIG